MRKQENIENESFTFYEEFDRCNIRHCTFANAMYVFDKCNIIECEGNFDEYTLIKSNLIEHEDLLDNEDEENMEMLDENNE